MVAALSLAKPTLVLGWGHKYAEAMDEFGVGEWAFEQGDDDPHAVIAKLADLIEQRETVSRKLASALPDMRLRAMAQIDAAADILTRPA
jgi:polysaccharide pyruvyl transferase WcaK-like protein